MPQNPYTRLLNEAKNFVWKLLHPRRIEMWTWSKENLENVSLSYFKQRIIAADQLGYRMIVEVDDKGGIKAIYEKKPDSTPYVLK